MQGETQIDGVSVNEDPVEGAELLNPAGDEIISKNKAVRRVCFIDTDDNASDFEILNYSKLPQNLLDSVVPRSTADGAWGPEPKPQKPDQELIQNLKDAIAEAGLTEQEKYTADSYERVMRELAEAQKVLEHPDAALPDVQKALEHLQKAISELQKKTEQNPDDDPKQKPDE